MEKTKHYLQSKRFLGAFAAFALAVAGLAFPAEIPTPMLLAAIAIAAVVALVGGLMAEDRLGHRTWPPPEKAPKVERAPLRERVDAFAARTMGDGQPQPKPRPVVNAEAAPPAAEPPPAAPKVVAPPPYALPAAAMPRARTPHPILDAPLAQIGRASWRERVYVLV